MNRRRAPPRPRNPPSLRRENAAVGVELAGRMGGVDEMVDGEEERGRKEKTAFGGFATAGTGSAAMKDARDSVPADTMDGPVTQPDRVTEGKEQWRDNHGRDGSPPATENDMKESRTSAGMAAAAETAKRQTTSIRRRPRQDALKPSEASNAGHSRSSSPDEQPRPAIPNPFFDHYPSPQSPARRDLGRYGSPYDGSRGPRFPDPALPHSFHRPGPSA
ncbi:uncharacterized protein K452DRAFT_361645, partial [Aplosporella prunicola CBS 121167]